MGGALERFHLGKCFFSRLLYLKKKFWLVVHTKYLLFFMVCFLQSMVCTIQEEASGGPAVAVALMHK